MDPKGILKPGVALVCYLGIRFVISSSRVAPEGWCLKVLWGLCVSTNADWCNTVRFPT